MIKYYIDNYGVIYGLDENLKPSEWIKVDVKPFNGQENIELMTSQLIKQLGSQKKELISCAELKIKLILKKFPNPKSLTTSDINNLIDWIYYIYSIEKLNISSDISIRWPSPPELNNLI